MRTQSSFIKRTVALATLVLAAAACARAVATPSSSIRPDRNRVEAAENGVALTVYNQGSALVQDRREFTFVEGFNEFAFDDVAAQIDPTSVLFKSITEPEGLTVLEQNYEYDLVGSSALLSKYLDQTIEVMTKDGDEYSGTLLSARDDVILQAPNGEVSIVRLSEIQQFSFPQLPDGLITKPTLRWRIMAEDDGDQEVEITYLTRGMSWSADYVVLLNEDETRLDLDGWVTLNNTSGATYLDALLKLVAGDLQRVADPGLAAQDMLLEAAEATRAAPVEQREFFEYHLYEIPRPVTVKNNETKQIEFVSSSNVAAEKFFVYDGAQCRSNRWYCTFYGYPQTDPSYGVASNPKVMVMVEFDTEEIEADLPKGRVRVYQEDVDGAALLVGEDAIDHTPEGERLRLYVGDAFDIVGERIQTDFERPSENSLQETYEITLRNHKDEAVEVRVVEHLFRWSDWRIRNASDDFSELDSSTIEFRVQIPADGEHTISYTVRYFWP